MTLEALLSKDFAALVRKLDADGFAERTMKRLQGVERMRLVAVGGAGAAGAAVAATQFQSLMGAFADAMPALAKVAVAETAVTLDIGAAPMMITALLFAIVGGATAMIAPGSR